MVWHFSEDPTIRQFVPRAGAPGAPAETVVWAIDEDHAPAYWFPRDCPRVTFWRGRDQPGALGEALLAGVGTWRVHAVEWTWLDRIRCATVYRYAFDAAVFEQWRRAGGHYVARRTVRPVQVEPLGDLLALHAGAAIELRLLPTIWPLVDSVQGSGLGFSIIRARNALPRAERPSGP